MIPTFFRLLLIALITLLAGCYNSVPITQALNPFPAQKPDLAQSVQEALLENDELATSKIHVEGFGDRVVLSGYVKKIRQSDTAELIARQVAGNQVENRIVVRP